MTTTTEYQRGQALGLPSVTLACYRCGIQFTVPEAFYLTRKADHEGFWCPLGHEQHYPAGKTKEQVLKERLAQAESNATFWMDQDKAERRAHEAERRRHAATKGQLTKTRKRAVNGVCPCCSRSFTNVRRHMQTQHPEQLEQMEKRLP